PWIHFPLGLMKALGDERIEWRLPTEPEPAMAGRRIPSPRGKVLGGTSAMNGMVYIRGQAEDYDAWAAAGCSGWGWADVLPWFVRAEANAAIGGPRHGRDGPLRVSSPQRGDALCEAIVAAGRGLGWPANDDFNGASQAGIGWYQHTLADGRRSTAWRGYLHGRPLPGLEVRHGTPVRRIVFDSAADGAPRAAGVLALVQGAERRLVARREVIVCAGSYHSPQLLQVSGIGDPAHLASLGVPVVAAAPAVGENLQDHIQARVRFTLNRPLGLNVLYHRPLHLAGELLRFALLRQGRCMAPPIRTGAFVRGDGAPGRPDLQFHFIEFTSTGMGQPPHREPGFWASVCALRPASRGRVAARTPAMADAPSIVGHYLADERDAQLTLAGVRLARALAQQPPLAGLVEAEADPGTALRDDAALLDWIRATAVTVYHPVGTCRMGGDAGSVVDPQLRVRGVQGLRVADASVMPMLVSGNTNAPATMIGERAADLVRRG
ncbi:MAG: GMC family oxidoreductase, partial [Aquabacterium sp.]